MGWNMGGMGGMGGAPHAYADFDEAEMSSKRKILSEKEYKKKVADFRKSLTKEGFLRDSNLTLSGPRADRLWDYFNEQLDHGRVVFTSDNAVHYSLPLTDMLEYVMLPFMIDAVAALLKQYRLLVWYPFLRLFPHEWLQELDHLLSALLTSDVVLTYVKPLFVCIIIYSMLQCLWIRFTPGLSKDTKAKAALYEEMMKKKGM